MGNKEYFKKDLSMEILISNSMAMPKIYKKVIQMTKQETMKAYCKGRNCKKITEWIKHADLPYWICTARGCNRRSKDPSKEKEIITKYENYFTFT